MKNIKLENVEKESKWAQWRAQRGGELSEGDEQGDVKRSTEPDGRRKNREN